MYDEVLAFAVATFFAGAVGAVGAGEFVTTGPTGPTVSCTTEGNAAPPPMAGFWVTTDGVPIGKPLDGAKAGSETAGNPFGFAVIVPVVVPVVVPIVVPPISGRALPIPLSG